MTQEILTAQQIHQKINRLAHQLIENCFTENEIFIGGIHGNGIKLAEKLAEILKVNSEIKVTIFEITVDKEQPWSNKIDLSIDPKTLNNQYIVLVDDVLNSGKTMQYALVELLKFPSKAIKTLTLVDRKHRRFPIKADFVGLSLSTTLHERVEIIMNNNETKAYLV